MGIGKAVRRLDTTLRVFYLRSIRRPREFTFDGRTYRFFYHRYNKT